MNRNGCQDSPFSNVTGCGERLTHAAAAAMLGLFAARRCLGLRVVGIDAEPMQDSLLRAGASEATAFGAKYDDPVPARSDAVRPIPR